MLILYVNKYRENCCINFLNILRCIWENWKLLSNTEHNLVSFLGFHTWKGIKSNPYNLVLEILIMVNHVRNRHRTINWWFSDLFVYMCYKVRSSLVPNFKILGQAEVLYGLE